MLAIRKGVDLSVRGYDRPFEYSGHRVFYCVLAFVKITLNFIRRIVPIFRVEKLVPLLFPQLIWRSLFFIVCSTNFRVFRFVLCEEHIFLKICHQI